MSLHLPLFLSLLLVGHLFAFDMWKIIEENNNKFINDPKRQSDDDGQRIVGGDIHMTMNDWQENQKAIKEKPQHSPNQQNLQPIFDYHRKLWKRNIPYVIDNSLSKSRDVILKSLQAIEKATCLKFTPQGYSDNNWIRFYFGAGCFSGIGRKYWKKKSTDISLGQRCDVESIIIHEVLHALGFFHEQSRLDRDSYLTIHENKVNPSMLSNFDKNDKFDTEYAGTPYDMKSIMQYGNGAFRMSGVEGNVMESKTDPAYPLGGNVLSHFDIIEINRRYQCEHVDLQGKKVTAIMRGWSKWSDWTHCGENWRKECSKARYRFCVDSNNCEGANKYGTDEDVRACTAAQCVADARYKDGIWGAWSEFTKCTGYPGCGWGVQERTRQCNNPIPSTNPKGKPCEGISIHRHLCRRRRCGEAGSLDASFEINWGKWSSKNFERKRGKASYNGLFGPDGDHTSMVESGGGYYAMAKKENREWSIITAQLTSPPLPSYKKACLTFYYMLNGPNIVKKNALSVFLKSSSGSTTNTQFVVGGHQGNQWKRGYVKIKDLSASSSIVIEANLGKGWAGSVVAIDDIVFDGGVECEAGLDKCEDLNDNCAKMAKDGKCSTNFRYMLTSCCKSCSDPKIKVQITEPVAEKCEDNKSYKEKCTGWAKDGECKKKSAVWMGKNCCLSCKNVKEKVTAKCEDNLTYKEKCSGWAKKGECKKNIKWMRENCCVSCKNVKEVKEVEQAETCKDKNPKCSQWTDYCKIKKNYVWMKENCKCTCLKTSKCVDLHKKPAECKKWATNKEKNYCKNSDWTRKNCCRTCYTN